MSRRCAQICKVLKQPSYALLAFISAFLLFVLLAVTSDYSLIAGNLGISYYYVTIIMQIIISALFGVNLALVVFRFMKLNAFSRRSSLLGTIAAFFALLVSGCGACGLSLAALLGFSSILVILPLHGMELKVLAIFVLLGSIYFAANPVLSCKRKTSKKVITE